jgi:hypothetical protein
MEGSRPQIPWPRAIPRCHKPIDMNEVGGQHCRGLRVQELPSDRIGFAASGAGGDLHGFENSLDGGRAHPVTELEQFALDPLVPPSTVFGGKPSISAAISALTGAVQSGSGRSTSG